MEKQAPQDRLNGKIEKDCLLDVEEEGEYKTSILALKRGEAWHKLGDLSHSVTTQKKGEEKQAPQSLLNGNIEKNHPMDGA